MTKHKWGEPVGFQFKTERSCLRPGCNLVKVTVHQPTEIPWREWWCDGARVVSETTPPCTGEIEVAYL